MNKKSRHDHLLELVDEKRTMVFYEAPHKLLATLKDFYRVFGDRKVALVRELTKIHEEVIRTTLAEAVNLYSDTAPKGEFVLLLEGAPYQEKAVCTIEDGFNIARELVEKGLSKTAAAKQAAAETGLKKSDIYKQLISEYAE